MDTLSTKPTLSQRRAANRHILPVPAKSSPSEASTRAPVRVVLATADMHMRESVRALLDHAGHGEFEVVAEAGSYASAQRFARAYQTCVLVLDLNMPRGCGLDAIALIRRDSPHAQIVALAAQDQAPLICQALRAGATGYVVQQCADSSMAYAVRCAAAGHGYLVARAPAVARPPHEWAR